MIKTDNTKHRVRILQDRTQILTQITQEDMRRGNIIAPQKTFLPGGDPDPERDTAIKILRYPHQVVTQVAGNRVVIMNQVAIPLTTAGLQ